MGHGLTADERDAYRKHGFVMRPRALDAATVAGLRDAVEAIHVQISTHAPASPEAERIDGLRFQQVLDSTVKWEWDEASPHIRSMEPFSHLDPRALAVLSDPRLTEPARDLLGEPICSFTDKLNFKRPGGSPFPWHQDTPYWAFGCDHADRLISVQVYLDDATRENGCLWMIPGSHLHGALPVFEDRGTIGRLYTDVDRFDGESPVAIEAPAGTAVFFHGDVVHGSQTNRTAESRRAVVLTYQPEGHPRWNRGEEAS
ncbi:MAG: phytanoyl-CoA dioxygenase family protein [Deltaproteobacteria bacterium]|nr:phytanoyl-CoA dioxygenase family protein [Deltaproteobacteria bacterium]